MRGCEHRLLVKPHHNQAGVLRLRHAHDDRGGDSNIHHDVGLRPGRRQLPQLRLRLIYFPLHERRCPVFRVRDGAGQRVHEGQFGVVLLRQFEHVGQRVQRSRRQVGGKHHSPQTSQRFYISDIGRNKALALAENLGPECIAVTEIRGLAFRLEEAIAREIDLGCNVVVCGVDNNPARVAASRHFRFKGIPVIFTGVSRDGDCGYVFVQEKHGPGILSEVAKARGFSSFVVR